MAKNVVIFILDPGYGKRGMLGPRSLPEIDRQERLAGKIGSMRRKTGRLRQAGRKGWQER